MTVFVIQRNYITLQILFVEYAVKGICCVARRAVLKSYRCARFVIHVYQRILLGEALAAVIAEIHRLAYDLTAAEHILGAGHIAHAELINFLARSDAVGVVGVGRSIIFVDVGLKLSAKPSQ